MIVYTGGTFDLFHEGHMNFLRQCRLLAGPNGSVIVSLNTDDFIERYKGRAPMQSYRVREAVLRNCTYVNKVVPNIGSEDSKPAIEAVDPDVVAIDTGWAFQDYYAQMSFTQQWLDERGIVLVYLPRTPGVSTTQLRQHLGQIQRQRQRELDDQE